MHRFLRTTGLASVGLAAVLLASGCSSSGPDKTSDKASAPSGTGSGAPAGTPAGSASGGSAGGKGGSPSHSAPGAAGGVDGDWVAVTQGKPVALVIKGKAASVLGEHQCNGTASSAAGTATLHLTCSDGNTNRTKGTARLNGAKLEVSWDGFGKDEFTRNKTPR
ncbi:hypothetical protein ACIQ9Q_18505 [Streptomyces sp. NPDC094438]|uniref:hypothetical protein n=1 Tax=Streptomyces sp. NPDC094438 TaxID=3366061 RepID=UPI0038100EDA